ncbi:hypothetical protein GNI_091830, partial [Gregarina niphandrodes]
MAIKQCLRVLEQRLCGDVCLVKQEWSPEAKEILGELDSFLVNARNSHSTIQSYSPESISEEIRKLNPGLGTKLLGHSPYPDDTAARIAGVANGTIYGLVIALAAVLSVEVGVATEIFLRCVDQKDLSGMVRQAVTHNLSTVLSTPLNQQGEGRLPVKLMEACLELWIEDQLHYVDTLMKLFELGNKIVGYNALERDVVSEEDLINGGQLTGDSSSCSDADTTIKPDPADTTDNTLHIDPREHVAGTDPRPMCPQTRKEVLNLLNILEAKGCFKVVVQRIMCCFSYFKDESKIQATVNSALNTSESLLVQLGLQLRSVQIPPGNVLPQLIHLTLPPEFFQITAAHRKSLLSANLGLLASMTTAVALQTKDNLYALISLAPHLFTISPMSFSADMQLVGPHIREYDLMVESASYETLIECRTTPLVTNAVGSVAPGSIYGLPSRLGQTGLTQAGLGQTGLGQTGLAQTGQAQPGLTQAPAGLSSLAGSDGFGGTGAGADSQPVVPVTELFEAGPFVTLVVMAATDGTALRIHSNGASWTTTPATPSEQPECLRGGAEDVAQLHAPGATVASLLSSDSVDGQICRWFHRLPKAAESHIAFMFLRYATVACHAASTLTHQSLLRLIFAVQQQLDQLFPPEQSGGLLAPLEREPATKGPTPSWFEEKELVASAALWLDSLLRRCPAVAPQVFPMCERLLKPTADHAQLVAITGASPFDELQSLVFCLGHLYVTLFAT